MLLFSFFLADFAEHGVRRVAAASVRHSPQQHRHQLLQSNARAILFCFVPHSFSFQLFTSEACDRFSRYQSLQYSTSG